MNYLDFLSPFSSAGHLCDLKGIDCDENNKFIEAINFHNKSLTGNLNTEIGLIESVKKICLSNNELKGKIDEAIFFEKLPNLETFDINSNSFEGEIPKTSLSHPSLKEFNLTSNLFVGTLPSSLLYPSILGQSSECYITSHYNELIFLLIFILSK